LQQQLGWQATKRAMARGARAMATATKRGMATNGDNTGNGHGKECGRGSTAAVMGWHKRTQPLALHLERGG
jgi:hypothetical protein